MNNVKGPLADEALDVLFRKARTHTAWLDQPVSDDTLGQLYELMKWGPTSANSSPARIVFLRSREAKQRLVPALSQMNVEKTVAAPVTAIVAYDLQFYERLTKLWPHNPGMKETFAKTPELARITALRNSSLQGGYLILAARSLGLDCGPMSGFDNAKVDAEFFGADSPEGTAWAQVRSNFLCNIGYGDKSKLMPRNPRLDFEEACVIL